MCTKSGVIRLSHEALQWVTHIMILMIDTTGRNNDNNKDIGNGNTKHNYAGYNRYKNNINNNKKISLAQLLLMNQRLNYTYT